MLDEWLLSGTMNRKADVTVRPLGNKLAAIPIYATLRTVNPFGTAR